jgi:glycosyltransferase involved in cell wall biosynthesis
MRLLFFAGRMPDLCGAFLHDIDLAIELQRRGHEVAFLALEVPKEGVNGGTYRGFKYMHYSAGGAYLDSSQAWICPHSPALPYVRKLNNRGYDRPIIATCHYDGNYSSIIINNPGRKIQWVEMLMFINSIMEPNYRKNIVPWPPNIIRTAVVRPLMHEDKIRIDEEFQGDYITLVNANQNKGVVQFIEMAKRMPERKFLAVRPYYGELQPPPAPDNIEWIPFDDDIRNILKQTRILVMPSYSESFGRIAVEAMYNGIPVIYSKINPKSKYPSASTEGLDAWIRPAGISVERENIDEWASAIRELDNEETYQAKRTLVKEHIQNMNMFTEGIRIAELVESFVRENPVAIRQTPQQAQKQKQIQAPQQTASQIVQPQGRVGFSNGRLRIQR